MNVLKRDNISLNVELKTKKECIDLAGKLLVCSGNVTKDYVKYMHQRDEDLSVYMGNFLAIPHGTSESGPYINETGISFIQLKEEVMFDGNPVRLVVGIAAKNNEHMEILSNLAILCSDMDNTNKLINANSVDDVLHMIEGR